MTNGAQNKPIVQSPRHPERQRKATHGVDQQLKTNQDQLVVKQPQDLEHQQPSHVVDDQSKATQDTEAVQSNQSSPSPGTTNLSPTFHAANSNVTQTTYNYTYMYGTGVTNAGVGGNDHHESSPNANANRAASEGTSKSHNSGSSRNSQSNEFNAREDDYEESEYYLDADTSDRGGSKGSKSQDSGHTRRKFAAEDNYEEDSRLDNYNTGHVSHGSRPSLNLRPNTPQGSHTGSSHPHNPRHTSENNYEDDLQPDNHVAGRVSHTSAPHLDPRLGPSRSNTARPGTFNHGPGHPHKWQSVNENDFEEPEDFQSGHLGSNVRMFSNPGFLPNRQPNHSNTGHGLAVSTGLFNFGLQI